MFDIENKKYVTNHHMYKIIFIKNIYFEMETLMFLLSVKITKI